MDGRWAGIFGEWAGGSRFGEQLQTAGKLLEDVQRRKRRERLGLTEREFGHIWTLLPALMAKFMGGLVRSRVQFNRFSQVN